LVAVCGGTTFRLSRRPSWRKLPRWVLRSFTTQNPAVLRVSHGMVASWQQANPLASRLTLLSLC
jgi:hypothetical protein